MVAGLALFVALDGSAVAARGLVEARDIAAGAVTGPKIKRKAIAIKHLSPSARKSLKGAQGAAGSVGPHGLSGTNGANGLTGSRGTDGTNGTVGPPGADGEDGTNGDPGLPGTDGEDGAITPLTATAGTVALPTATPPTTVVEKTSVPAGKYIVMAKTQLSHSGAGDSVHCDLKAGSQTLDQVDMKTLPALAAIPVSMQAVTTTSSPGSLSVSCDVSVANGAADHSSLIAVPAN